MFYDSLCLAPLFKKIKGWQTPFSETANSYKHELTLVHSSHLAPLFL